MVNSRWLFFQIRYMLAQHFAVCVRPLIHAAADGYQWGTCFKRAWFVTESCDSSARNRYSDLSVASA